MSDFSFTTEIKNHILYIKMKGRILEKDQTIELLNQVSSSLTEETNNVILDLKELDYINSNGLNSFINILTKARNAGGEAVIINVSEKIKKLLLISKLNTVFTIKENEVEANNFLN